MAKQSKPATQTTSTVQATAYADCASNITVNQTMHTSLDGVSVYGTVDVSWTPVTSAVRYAIFGECGSNPNDTRKQLGIYNPGYPNKMFISQMDMALEGTWNMELWAYTDTAVICVQPFTAVINWPQY